MTNQNNLIGKIALVTGASSGIGKAIALELAKHGADLIITYNTNSKGAEDISKKIRLLSGHAYVIKSDLSKESDRLNLKKEIYKITKKLDILVNNAGFFNENDGPDLSSGEMEKIFSVHAIATLRVCSMVHPLMNKNSSIINISSIHGVHPQAHTIVYGASKSAMNSLTISLAQTYAPIRVNTISPGYTETPMWGNDKKLIKKLAKETLLKRFGSPEEIAKVALFLASEDSSYITGANIIVDGGALIK